MVEILWAYLRKVANIWTSKASDYPELNYFNVDCANNEFFIAQTDLGYRAWQLHIFAVALFSTVDVKHVTEVVLKEIMLFYMDGCDLFPHHIFGFMNSNVCMYKKKAIIIIRSSITEVVSRFHPVPILHLVGVR